jgi:hypothetical protein
MLALRRTTSLLLAATLLVASSCSQQENEASGEDVIEASGEDAKSPQLALEGIMEEMLTSVALIQRAEDLYIFECMREQGFYYPEIVPDRGGNVAQSFTPDLSDWPAATDGYWFQDTYREDENTDQDPSLTEYFETLDKSEQEAWQRAFSSGEAVEIEIGSMVIGSNSSGCLAEARRYVAGSSGDQPDDVDRRFMAIVTYVSSLSTEVDAMVYADPMMVTVVEGWQQCMEGHGYSFKSLDDAVDTALLTRGPEQAGPSSSEIEQAVADKGCQIEVSYFDTYRQVYAEKEAERLQDPDVEALLLEWSEMSDDVEERAVELLREAGQPVSES